MASFIPEPNVWIDSHLNYIPDELIRVCGDLKGRRVLDVGCGTMLADFGLIARGISPVTGLDVPDHPYNVVERTAGEISESGLPLPRNYAGQLTYVPYDGVTFPFGDGEFDFVYSWSAFEHIPDVARVLSEIRRVMTPEGRAFLQVYPWFPSYWGSHLSDYISEPYFHLTRPLEWVHEQLQAYATAHPSETEFVLGHMWHEYQTLNKYSAKQFIAAVLSAGFCIERLETTIREEHIDRRPASLSKADATAAGTTVLLRSGK